MLTKKKLQRSGLTRKQAVKFNKSVDTQAVQDSETARVLAEFPRDGKRGTQPRHAREAQPNVLGIL